MAEKTSYTLPELGYDFKALEPVFSAEALEIHYSKHHRAYVDKLNEALDKYHAAEMKKDIQDMIPIQKAIEFNGGGHINHSFFWKNLSPKGKRKPEGALLEGLKKEFGSFEEFQTKFNAEALAVKGSGWAWLAYDKTVRDLHIIVTSNHGTVRSLGLVPLMVVDVWEHAYYLQYKNERARYLKEIWNVLDFDEIEKRYAKVL